MTPERWQQVERLYQAALEREPSLRAPFLREACGGDEQLRQEVESLLAYEPQAERFIEAPALQEAAQGFSADQASSLVGRQLGTFKVLSLIGAGGMGEVYRAKDSRLNRTVAIKVLHTDKMVDPERKRRFIQEARAASALNHPNIVTIYEINRDNGVDFIAMEYVSGKTLDQILPRKGLRLGEALKYAVQMADALAKAHGAGIVHRDLKPANVMVTEEGLVKVLDFGLAKLVEPTESHQGPETMTTKQDGPTSTEEGTILGTVAYMSPEQAEGKKVDARSDIFSFGSVLYEMLTGQRAFQGDSKMSTLAAILNKEPKPVTDLAEGIPRDLEKILSRCLRKDRERRLQHMDDLKVALQELKEESDSGKLVAAPAPQRGRRRSLIWGAALLALLGAVAVAVWFSRSHSVVPEEPLTAVPLTSYPGYEGQPSFSPDGNQVTFVWDGEKQDNRDIYIKLIGGGPPLPLTHHPAADFSPAWSPDGRSIAFLRELSGGRAAVLLIPALGGPERKLAEPGPVTDLPGPYLAWSPNGNCLAITEKVPGNEPAGLFLLSIETGEKRRLTSPPANSVGDGSLAFSPDGHTLAFSRSSGIGISDLYLLALSDSLQPVGEVKRLTFDNRNTFSPTWTADGREIIFASGQFGSNVSLWRLAGSGSGKPQRLASLGEDAYELTIARQGRRLAYTRQVSDTNVYRVGVAGPQGKPSPPTSFISSTRPDGNPQFSPDGKRIVFASGRSSRTGFEIWVCDSDGSGAVQLTSFGAHSGTPRWSPDGERIGFDSNVEGQWEVYVVSANGGRPQRLTSNPASDDSPSWSRDGKWVYFASNRSGAHQVCKMPANGGEAVPVTRKGGYSGFESPDGKWLYYAKDFSATSLWKVPVQGGEETQVVESLRDYSTFAVADEGIYFIPRPDSVAGSSIQFFSFANGEIRVLATLEKPAAPGLTVSPDRQWILYSQEDQLGSDLMLVENFH
jgi:eukaryotic-like serine/threonine-protein kinase